MLGLRFTTFIQNEKLALEKLFALMKPNKLFAYNV